MSIWVYCWGLSPQPFPSSDHSTEVLLLKVIVTYSTQIHYWYPWDQWTTIGCSLSKQRTNITSFPIVVVELLGWCRQQLL